MSNRGDEFKVFAQLVVDHIDNYTTKQYGDAPNDNVEKWNSEKCMDAIERYVKRFGIRNGRGEEDNLLSCLKIAHYACLAYNKRKREIEQHKNRQTTIVCEYCGYDDVPSLLLTKEKTSLYCERCNSHIKDIETIDVSTILCIHN